MNAFDAFIKACAEDSINGYPDTALENPIIDADAAAAQDESIEEEEPILCRCEQRGCEG